MDQLFQAFRYLARRYSSRWSYLDDALANIRASDGEKSDSGEQARRMLKNAFRTQAYLDKVRDAADTDRANALRSLAKPLAEALGHMVTIEMADAILAEVRRAEQERVEALSTAEKDARSSPYTKLISALNQQGVTRGHCATLSDLEVKVIAKYIIRKVRRHTNGLPVPRGVQASQTAGRRLHPIWNPFILPRKPGT